MLNDRHYLSARLSTIAASALVECIAGQKQLEQVPGAAWGGACWGGPEKQG